MLSILLLSATALVGTPAVTWTAPGSFIDGAPFQVSVEITVPEGGATVPAWLVSGAAFEVNGKALGDRGGDATLAMAAGAHMTLSYDLGPMIASANGLSGKDFKLGFAKDFDSAAASEVNVYQAAPNGLDFMSMPAAELSNFSIVMNTTRGEMVMEMWPDNAPNHVRNFLDLSYNKFYNGLTFHRVIPGFMIQGGCPNGAGNGNGPRMVKAEFSDSKAHSHVPGVLSMARTNDPDSASCQFFVMHENSAHLDGKYSAFGKLISGIEIVDMIVSTPTNAGAKPTPTQYILSSTVVRAAK
ncbi:MAG: peptidyl-prolyl cis-trans isomerase B (cyclophilin B) [Planctomycetota bacterium]|jgi:peptidyl-prolyl cis-trans isomerase B (cyclophilin B)